MSKNTQEQKNIGEKLVALYVAHTEACNAHHAALQALRLQEREILNIPADEDYMLSIKANDHENEMHKLGGELFSQLVRRAEVLFAPDGGRLSIDHEGPREAMGENYDFAAAWKYLEATYGGDKGEEEGYRQTAEKLVRAFDLNRKTEIERKGGCVVLNVHVWIDSFDKKHGGKSKLSYSCVEDVMAVYSNLATFATWAQRDFLASNLRSGAHRWWSDKEIRTREKLVYGDGDGEIELVTYSSRFEWRIRNDVAEQLQVFIGTFAPQSMQEAA